MSWRMQGTLLELCSCAPGCDCNFRGVPNSEEGNCEALACHRVDTGHFGEVDLSGVTFVMAYWWPGAIHDKGGRARGYVDCRDDAQFEAIRSVVSGEVGHDFFQIFNSTYERPPVLERATIDAVFDGKGSRFSVEGVATARLEPLRNPVSGAENDVRIVKPGGFIWKDGHVAQGAQLTVDLPEMSFDHTGRHAVVAAFDWSVD
ncbi:MAG: DUF1326 domain-containing protein [Actinobacteria bacterium]|nr:DUF1326 domain-containing protein [Actinomycetota bacterium]